MKRTAIIVFLTLIFYHPGKAQVYDPVSWDFSSKQLSGSVYELQFTATIDEGWHMYGLNIPSAGPIPTSFQFEVSNDFELIGELEPDSPPEVKFDPTFEMDVELFSSKVKFTQEIKVSAGRVVNITGSLEYMACDDSRCLPPKEEDFGFVIKPESIVQESIPEKTTEKELTETPQVFTTRKLEIGNENIADSTGIEYSETKTIGIIDDEKEEKDTERSLLSLFLLALAAGFGALLTPCVYPIIPLTVSFFMRDTSRSRAIYNGLFFGLSIVFIYTLVGLIVGILKIDLVRLVSAHWLPNLIFLLIFLALAFSFFGMFEITLPGSLSNRIDQQAEKGGFLGPFFMALATVVISFSCTGPIVGVLLGSALQGEIIKPVIGMLGFSITFALPFTLLAIFPGFMKKLPKSGGWLNSVKVFFAFILLAFSLVFLTNMGLGFVSRNLIIALYIVIFMILGIYLLGKIRFAHDSDLHHVSVPRLLLAIASFAFAIYMVPGLFGASLKVIEPFLPAKTSVAFDILKPATTSPGYPLSTHAGQTVCTDTPKFGELLEMPLGLKGYFDYEEALACARELNKPVLLDFAGHSCKNCKKMYAEVWSHPEVLHLLRNEFVIAVLYTDDRTKLPEEEWVTSPVDGKIKKTIGKKFGALQIEKFGSNALPLYAVVDGGGNILTSEKYYTYSPNVSSFMEFLQNGMENF